MTHPRCAMADPRTGLLDPRVTIPDTRGSLSVCTCGLPNCPRVATPGGPHGPSFSPEGHYQPHGLSLPMGGAAVGHVDPAVLYSMNAAYGLKDSPEIMRGLPQLNGYYPYDPTAVYPYMNGYAGIDARRKNATKESTNTLKAWLFEHRKNPYPTKGEKIMLAILTKMTLTQVSTWFANARRRLKKENKMTWTSKDDDLDGDDDELGSEQNSDIDNVNVSGSSAGDDRRRQVSSSIGDDDDILSIISGGDEIDVEDNGDVSDELQTRIPSLLPHGLPVSAANMFLSHPHPSSYPHPAIMTSLRRCTTSPSLDNKDGGSKRESESPYSNSELKDTRGECLTSSNSPKPGHVTPITPPPSPKDIKSSQSTSSLHSHNHYSSATIHHHPTTSHETNRSSSLSSSSLSSPSSSSSPTKPKIWSIADVVGTKDKKDNETSSHNSHVLRNQTNSAMPIVTIGGAPSHLDRMHNGFPHPQTIPGMPMTAIDSSYNLAYYPYGLPHPAAAALMASQASHLAAARMPHPHPYSRMPGGVIGHPALNGQPPLSIRTDFASLTRGPSHHHQPTRVSPHREPSESRRHESNGKHHDSAVTRLVGEKAHSACNPTAFTPVAHRQV